MYIFHNLLIVCYGIAQKKFATNTAIILKSSGRIQNITLKMVPVANVQNLNLKSDEDVGREDSLIIFDRIPAFPGYFYVFFIFLFWQVNIKSRAFQISIISSLYEEISCYNRSSFRTYK